MEPNYKITAALIALEVVAIFLLGRGINGFVVSESCCFGSECAVENMCEAAQPELNYPAQVNQNLAYVFFGGALGLLTLIVHFYHKRGYHKED